MGPDRRRVLFHGRPDGGPQDTTCPLRDVYCAGKGVTWKAAARTAGGANAPGAGAMVNGAGCFTAEASAGEEIKKEEAEENIL